MKFFYVGLLLISSLLLLFVGTLFKILHWPFNSELQLAGTLTGVIGVGGLLLKLRSKKTR